MLLISKAFAPDSIFGRDSRNLKARLMVSRWIPGVGLSLTQDKLVMTMAEESGSIWVLDNVDH